MDADANTDPDAGGYSNSSSALKWKRAKNGYSLTLRMSDNSRTSFTCLDKQWLTGWLVVLRIYVALAVFQRYRDLEAGDNQSLKS